MTIGIEEILLRLAKLIGKVVYKLKEFNLHELYKEKFIEFFQEICSHKDVEMRR